MKLEIKQNKTSGVLVYKYAPLRNLLQNGHIENFTTNKLNITPINNIFIECQPSYDDSTNLIITDNKNIPKLINSRFTKVEGNQFRIVNRNQKNQTNLYREDCLETDTNLLLRSNKCCKIDLKDINYSGRLKGGNYVFYIAYCDEDNNETPIICESGIVSIFKGTLYNLNTISGTLLDERTDKSITLQISNLDVTYNKIQIYYSRATSDTNGFLVNTYYRINNSYDITGNVTEVIINGFEEETAITAEELNTNYLSISSAKTLAQVQNMLFLGNLEEEIPDNKTLASLSYYIQVSLKQKKESIGYVNPETYTVRSTDSWEQSEYFSPKNIYYNLGYWPDEFYRLGVVYIMKDGSLSPVYNLRGCNFKTKDVNYTEMTYNSVWETSEKYEIQDYEGISVCYDESGNIISKLIGTTWFYFTKEFGWKEKSEDFNPNSKIVSNKDIEAMHVNLHLANSNKINFIESNIIKDDLTNTYGVFKNNKVNINDGNSIKPLYYEMYLSEELIAQLATFGITGLFFVRQKRIPTIIGQGLGIGVHGKINAPGIQISGSGKFVYESFHTIDNDRLLSEDNNLSTRKQLENVVSVHNAGLLSLDAICKPELQSLFDGSEFVLQTQGTCTISNVDRTFYQSSYQTSDIPSLLSSRVLYIDEDVPVKVIDDIPFSTRLGSAEAVSDFARLTDTQNGPCFRGIYCGFLGTTSKGVSPNTVYNILYGNYSEQYFKEYIKTRGEDNSPFFAISDRYSLDEIKTVDCYRGDCYSCTVTIRLNRNFIDSEIPVSDNIMDEKTWADNYKGYNKLSAENGTDYSKINRADLNNVPLGMWISYKCLSNYNLNIRSEDNSYVDETALMGNNRSFFPLRSKSIKSSCKVPETKLLNAGYSTTTSNRWNFKWDDVPYTRNIFDNRVAFSNIQTQNEFKNGYRVFQSLQYKDIDRQFGAIVKLIAWGRDLLCVFEHGIGILPVNLQALFNTDTNQSIALKGAGVLTSNVTVLSQDFGSIWADSIIRTDIGVYGVDSYAKKIWRVTMGSNQVEIISDFKVQKFLNDNIKLSEVDQSSIAAIKNIKSHYNAFKGDVMFTFYNTSQETKWNLCYNERLGKWVTRYSWIPICSDNINNTYFSLDQQRSEIYSIIYNNKHTENGIRVSDSELVLYDEDSKLYVSRNTILSLTGYENVTSLNTIVKSMETSYIKDGYEHLIRITDYPMTETETYIDPEDPEEKEQTRIFYYKNLEYFFTVDYNGRENLLSVSVDHLKEWFKSVSGYDDIPAYLKLTLDANLYVKDALASVTLHDTVGLLLTSKKDGPSMTSRDLLLRNAFYVHGRSGVFDEIQYRDASFDNQILPTKWYDKQEPFEFEFVVNGDVGLHKIFNNLVIISNNVQPKEFEFEIVGDVYGFNKEGIFRSEEFIKDPGPSATEEEKEKYRKAKQQEEYKPAQIKYSENHPYQTSQIFENCDIIWDDNTNSYSIRLKQPTFNMNQVGRLMGNIQYKEDAWYLTIDPIKHKNKYLMDDVEYKGNETNVTRIRDKYLKVRVKYSGTQLAIITAIRTLFTISYA